ncbi:DUF1294 domain-containing protein [Paenibacillus taichungensis]
MVLILYLLIVNLGGFIVMGVDKKRSQNSEWRVPEKRLFGFAFFGGALGILGGMYTFRHKTKHWSFRIGVPLLLCLNVVAVYYLLKLTLKL